MADDKKKTDLDKAPAWAWWLLIFFFLLIIGLGWFLTREKTERVGTQYRQPITQKAETENWQLCWLKKPEYEGKTSERDRCLPAKIESRSDSHVIISYSYPGGKGVQQGTSTDGKNYDGEWKDSTGWGKWHLKFVSSDTAFGWSDDEGKGEKQPNVLERT